MYPAQTYCDFRPLLIGVLCVTLPLGARTKPVQNYVILNVAERSEESKAEGWRFLAVLGMTWGCLE